MDDDADADEDPFGFDMLPGGSDGKIWIVCVVVFLSQQKVWRDERDSVAGDPTEDIWVGICGVSWFSRE